MEVMEKIRKWGIYFDGTRDPLEFIERTEELSDMYGESVDVLPKLMPEFLRDRALTWFRNNNKFWVKWNDFKFDFCKFFLPPRYYEKLEDEIQNRTQRRNEKFKDYLLALQNLMRHTKLSEVQKLERIYRNCHADYQWYIKRKDFSSLLELTTLAEDLESIKNRPQQNNDNSSRQPNTSTFSGQQRSRCQSCGGNGHENGRCPNKGSNSGNPFGGRRN